MIQDIQSQQQDQASEMEKIRQLQLQKEELQKTIESLGTSSNEGSIDRDVGSPTSSGINSDAVNVGNKVGTLDFGGEASDKGERRDAPKQKRLKRDKSVKMGAKAKKDAIEDMQRRLE